MKSYVFPKIIFGNHTKVKKVNLVGRIISQYRYICKIMNFKSKIIEEYYRDISVLHFKQNFKNNMKILIIYWCGKLWLNEVLSPTLIYSCGLELVCLIFNLICYISTIFISTPDQLERLCVVVLVMLFASILADMRYPTAMIEIQFTPITQVALLMFSNLSISILNSIMLWVISYGILSVGVFANLDCQKNYPDLFKAIKEYLTIEELKQVSLYDKKIIETQLMYSYLILGFGISVVCLILHLFNSFNRRSSFLKLNKNIQTKLQQKVAIRVQLHWIDTIMPELVKDVFWNHQEKFKFNKWIYNKSFDDVSILLADIVGFAFLNVDRTAYQIVRLLNDLFNRFDELCSLSNCEKLCSLGDCYYCISGCPTIREDHAVSCIEMGLGMCRIIRLFNRDYRENINLQLGIHSGFIYGAVIGKKRFRFDIYSPDVNIAKGMKSNGRPGTIHISQTVYNYVRDVYSVKEGNNFEMKNDNGAVTMVLKTYFIDPKKPYLYDNNEDRKKDEDMKLLPSMSSRHSHFADTSFSEDSDETESQKPVIDKTQYRKKITSDLEFIDQIRYDPEQKVRLLTNPSIKFFSLKFDDKELEWHYSIHQPDYGDELDLDIQKLVFLVDCSISFLYSVLIYLVFLILFPEITGKMVLIIGVANVLSIIVIIIMIWQCYKYKDDSINFFANTVHSFFTKNQLMIFITNLYFQSSPLVIIIITLNDCTKTDIDYIFIIKYFTLIFFSLFLIPLYFSANYFMKLFVCILNVSLAVTVFILKPCVKRQVFYTFPYYTCFGQMNLTNIEFFKKEHYNIFFQLGITFILMVLIFREYELNVRILFSITRELEISCEETIRTANNTKDLLYNIIPMYVFNELKYHPKNQKEMTYFHYAVSIPKAAVIFACISNLFLTPFQLDNDTKLNFITLLHKIICAFDDIIKKDIYRDVEKIKTINDCYIVASGLNLKDCRKNSGKNDYLNSLMYYAFEMIDSLNFINEHCLMGTIKFEIKIGYNIGPLIAGIIGGTKPLYDILGSTVNLCGRLFAHNRPGAIQVSEYVSSELSTEFEFKYNGTIFDENKKEVVTYFCVGPINKPHKDNDYSLIISSRLELTKQTPSIKKTKRYSFMAEKDRKYSILRITDNMEERSKSTISIRRSSRSIIDSNYVGFTFD